MSAHRFAPGDRVPVRLGLACLLLVAGVLSSGCGKKASVAVDHSALPADLALVPPDATAFVRIRVAELMKSDFVKSIKQLLGGDFDTAEKEMTKELGIRLADIENVTVVVLSMQGPPIGEPPPVLAAVATSVAVDRNKLLGKTMPNAVERTHQGRTYYLKEPGDAAVHFVSDRLVLIGTENAVKRFLESGIKAGPGRLDAALKAATESHHVVAGAQLPDWIEKEMRDAPLPPPLDFLKPLLEMQSATVTLDLGKELVYDVRLAYADKSKAKDAAEALKKGVDMVRQQLRMLPNAGDEPMAAMLKQTDKFFDGVTIEQQETEVVVNTRFDSATYVALLVPAVQKVREAANKVTSANNLKQIGIAIHDYEADHRRFPPQAITNKEGKPLLSWRVEILPYVEQQGLYKQFKLDEPWDSTHNKALLEKMPKVYLHPAANIKEPGMTHYQAFAGPKTVFEPNQKIGFSSLLDGSSNIVMLIDAGEPVPWTKPEDLTYDPKKPLPKLGRLFSTGFNALFCDGHVRTIDHDIDQKFLRQIIERDDGVPVDLNRLSK